MTPHVAIAITATNQTKPAFGDVVKDANAAAGQVAAAAGRADGALARQNGQLMALGKSSAMAANQQRNLAFQLNDVAVSLAGGANPLLVLAQQGSQIAAIYGPEEGGIGRAFKETGNLATGLATKFWPVAVAVGAVSVAVAALTTEINRGQETQVGFFDVMRAGWELASENVMQTFKPVVDWLGGIWDWLSPIISDGLINLVRNFDLAFKDIKTIWTMLPAALGDATIKTANAVIDGLEEMINQSVDLLNENLIKPIQESLRAIGIDVGLVPHVAFGDGVPNPWAGAEDDYVRQMAQNRYDVMNTDYGGMVGNRARANVIAAAAEKASKAEKATKSLADNGFGKLIGKTNEFAEAARSAFSDMGTGMIEAFKKGGNVAVNVLNMVADRVMQLGETLLNQGLNGLLNMGISALFGGVGSGLGTGAIGRGVYGGMGGFFPAFPGMAEGGTVAKGGLSWVGEQGKELMYVPGGAQVIPHRQSMQMAGSGGAPTVTVKIDARGAQLGVAEQIDQWARLKLPGLVQKSIRDPYAVGA